jgi:HlyD family secretion protein
MTRRIAQGIVVVWVAAVAVGCGHGRDQPARASGYVDATEVTIASKVPGRVGTVSLVEGMRVTAGQPVVTIATTDTDLALGGARAERAQAAAALRLAEAGARPEEIQQAEANVAAASADVGAARTELDAATVDLGRFDQLLRDRAGSQKQRDDAAARRDVAASRLKGATDRVAAAQAALARLRAGARPQELDAARARVAAADAQIATLDNARTEATVLAPATGVVTSRLVEPGELVAVGTPLGVIVDLDHAWVNAYVEEPLVPSLRVGQTLSVVTDAGDRLAGQIAFIAPRAEFTPRNVQTAAERAKLVYRVKVTVDNRQGVLKPGMPAEVELASR